MFFNSHGGAGRKSFPKGSAPQSGAAHGIERNRFAKQSFFGARDFQQQRIATNGSASQGRALQSIAKKRRAF